MLGGYRSPSLTVSYGSETASSSRGQSSDAETGEEEEEESSAEDADGEADDSFESTEESPTESQESESFSSMPPILNFQLSEESEDGNIQEYTTTAQVRQRLLLNVDQLLYGSLADKLTGFLRTRFLERHVVFRVWMRFTMEFIRPTDQGSQTIAAPFNQEVIYIAEPSGIAADVSKCMSDLLEKIELFVSSGSGWILLNFLHARADLAYENHAFNNIGHGRGPDRMLEAH